MFEDQGLTVPSYMSGLRNFKMAKLEDTRNPHIDSPEKYPHLKTKKHAPNETTGKISI